MAKTLASWTLEQAWSPEVTDNDGSFHVWARNLDRALQLQAKVGAAFEFNLRNFAVDLATLDEVGSADDSTFRVELLTPDCRVTAANENGAWRGAAFRFVGWEMAA